HHRGRVGGGAGGRGLGSLCTPRPPHLPRPRDGGGALADPRRASSGDPACVGDSLANREELTQNVGRRSPRLPALSPQWFESVIRGSLPKEGGTDPSASFADVLYSTDSD